MQRPVRRLAAVLALGLVAGACRGGSAPDDIFHGGPVLTVNAHDQVARALAVRDGKVLAVGADEAVLALADSGTRIHDLAGRAVAPGFVAVHEHPAIAAVFGGVADISGFTHPTNSSVQAALYRAVLETPEGEWIFATGLDPLLVGDLEMPTRASLDTLTTHHPVVVVAQSLHSAWVNSMALERLGITRDTPDPGNGSYYERDADGELTGFVAETSAIAPFAEVLKSPWRMLWRYQDVLDDFLAGGYTTVTSLGYNAPALLARWSATSWLRPRIRQFFYATTSELDQLPTAPEFRDDFFGFLGIKLWYDGSPYTGSMYLDEPYLDSPLATSLGIESGSRGASRLGPEEFARALDQATAGGWPVAVHSQGDASGREVTSALSQAARTRGAIPDRIEHCLLLGDRELDELARLGVSPSFHINHLYFYGDALADSLLGAERAERMLPLARAFELDMHPTLHADSPMFPADPMHLMQTAVLRRTSSGRLLGGDQAVSVQQALRAMTANGAWQLGRAARLGSLEPGKQADLVVLSANPYDVDPRDLRKVKVLETWVAGRLRSKAVARTP